METIATVVLASRRDGRVVRVAVDGVDGAGKTVFADELAGCLRQRGASVVRASVDGFHHPPEVRYRRGRHSPEGFFLDSYDYPALRRLLLDPLAEGGDRRIVRRIYDVQAETGVEPSVESVVDVEVLVFDGLFVHRPELRGYWDHTVFLEVDFDISIPRGARRGSGDPDPAAASNRRYIEGQRRYLTTCHPRRHATWVVDNNDLLDAHIRRHPARTVPVLQGGRPVQERVYVDLVGDLFHAGHVELLRAARSFGDWLVVGVLSDEVVEGYKRRPIMTLEERVAVVRACRYVDEVVAGAPDVVTLEFLREHGISMVVHGDDLSEEAIATVYAEIEAAGMLRLVPRRTGLSTTELIHRVRDRGTED